MNLDSQLISMPEDVQNANQVKEIVLGTLLVNEVITKEQYVTYTEDWQIIIIKPKWFSVWAKKIGINTLDYIYKYVKFCEVP
jgi:hypothetical protein